MFRDGGDRARFLEVLSDVVARYGWICYYCPMANHYRLPIETPGAKLSRGIELLNGVYTQWFNCRHQRVRHRAARRRWMRAQVSFRMQSG